MQNLIKLLFTFLIASAIFSCKKNVSMITYDSGIAPVLSANKTTTIPLAFATKDNEAVTFTWTNPAYKFSTGSSSQDVSYLIEIDTTGANFTSPVKKSLGLSKDLSKTFTQTELNDILYSQMKLVAGMSHNIQIRVTSTLVNSSLPLTSNVLSFVVTPYSIPPKVNPPASGQLFLVGSATAGGWNNPVPVPSQQFTRVSPTLFEITTTLIGGQEYLILPVNGDWSHKYAVPNKTLSGLSSGGDFKLDASDNFPGPGVSGNYKISVDFQAGTFTVTKL